MSTDSSHDATWFPRACRAARAWLGWRAEDLAVRLAVSRRLIVRVEAGERTTPERRSQIAAAFAAEGVGIGPDGLCVEAPPGRPRATPAVGRVER